MRHNNGKRWPGSRGFTLVEVIVVLVILAILAAIMIPSMVGWIEKAGQKALVAACRSCVTAAQTLVVEEYGRTGKGAAPDADDILLLAELTGKGSVPYVAVNPDNAQVDHLTYRDNAGNIVTYCRDGLCGAHYVFRTVSGILYAGGNTPGNSLSDAYAALSGTPSRVDSEAPDGDFTAEVLAYLAANNIDLGSFNVHSWSMVQESAAQRAFTFTDADISTMQVGDRVRAIRYNERTGTYTAGYSAIVSATNQYKPGSAVYNGISSTGAAWTEYRTATVTQDSTTKSSYETTLAIFNDMPETQP